MKKRLSFSNKFFQIYLVEKAKKLQIEKNGILVNIGRKEIKLRDSKSLAPYKSYLLKDFELESIDKAILVAFDFDPARTNKYLEEFCKKNWHDNKVRYPNNPEKWHYKILMSPKDKIGNWEFNAWFLPANTASSIHNEHPFPKEVHTQIYGLGIMNKFKNPDPETLYQREYMPPGYTHDIFYDKNLKYPWHQYEAVTASIWMVIVEY